MLSAYTQNKNIPIEPTAKDKLSTWLVKQSESVKNAIKANDFSAKANQYCLLLNQQGLLERVVAGVEGDADIWAIAELPLQLPEDDYYLDDSQTLLDPKQASIGWGLGAYQFTRYKKPQRDCAKLFLADNIQKEVQDCIQSIYLVRDLVNTPASDLTPLAIAGQAQQLAEAFSAEVNIIEGDELLEKNYPAVHAVGRASDNKPCFIDLNWGNSQHKKLTLVGKGVCFDSGGLDLKTAAGMRTMSKDMGGSAHALGLARMIMAANLPICLRVLISAVENSVSGNAYRPGDVVKTRKGITVEIHNTDAEGRMILSDALTTACEEGNPDLLIDFATLTGASRVALGTEIPGFFTRNKQLAQQISLYSEKNHDLVWQLPLHKSYDNLLKSNIADVSNCANSSWAGAITAALFLERFVKDDTQWVHFDLMAANENPLPGRPEGGEAQGLRGLFDYLQDWVNEVK